MIELPIVIFLGLFALAMLFWVLFSFFDVYHAVKFGMASKINEFFLGIFLVGSLLLAGIGYSLIANIDWSQSIVLF